jgi:hypothetical protein
MHVVGIVYDWLVSSLYHSLSASKSSLGSIERESNLCYLISQQGELGILMIGRAGSESRFCYESESESMLSVSKLSKLVTPCSLAVLAAGYRLYHTHWTMSCGARSPNLKLSLSASILRP